MKTANKKLIMETLSNGGFIEVDLYVKCYLCDSEYNRLYAVRFDTYLKMMRESKMKCYYRFKPVTMTSSEYYK